MQFRLQVLRCIFDTSFRCEARRVSEAVSRHTASELQRRIALKESG